MKQKDTKASDVEGADMESDTVAKPLVMASLETGRYSSKGEFVVLLIRCLAHHGRSVVLSKPTRDTSTRTPHPSTVARCLALLYRHLAVMSLFPSCWSGGNLPPWQCGQSCVNYIRHFSTTNVGCALPFSSSYGE